MPPHVTFLRYKVFKQQLSNIIDPPCGVVMLFSPHSSLCIACHDFWARWRTTRHFKRRISSYPSKCRDRFGRVCRCWGGKFSWWNGLWGRSSGNPREGRAPIWRRRPQRGIPPDLNKNNWFWTQHNHHSKYTQLHVFNRPQKAWLIGPMLEGLMVFVPRAIYYC